MRYGYNNSEPKTRQEVFVMSITATELKTNLSKYLLLSATEDIYITRNGKVISKRKGLGKYEGASGYLRDRRCAAKP